MRQFLSYIHFLRGVAILYVVSVHARGFESYWNSSPEVYSFLDTFSDPSEGNGTTMFLFIGGFLFQHLNRGRFHFGKYMTQKFKNLIMPYVVISIPILIWRFHTNFAALFVPEDFHERSAFMQVVHFMFTGSHLPPFWFISTIILFYFVAPILHALDNKKFYRFGFPVLLLVALFTYRPEHNANPLLSFIHFIPVYVTGMWASYYKDRILRDDPKIFIGLLIVYLALCTAELMGWVTLPRTTNFEDVIEGRMLLFNVYLLKALVLCFLWLQFFYQVRHKKFPVLEQLGHYSFGLFFVHYFFISFSRNAYEMMGWEFDFSVFTYLIYFLLVLGASVVAVYMVKRITGSYSRYLIGS